MKKIFLILGILVLSLNTYAGAGNLLKIPAKYILKKVGIKTGSEVLSEGTEVAIKISCRETTEMAVKLATKYGDDVGMLFAKYGDDAVRITAKYGDDAVKLFSKHGDDMMRITRKYGDDGIGVFIKHSKELRSLMTKYGDDIIKPYIDHPGLGGKLVEEFGEDAVKISGKMTDGAAIVMLKRAENVNKRSLINKILFYKNGKVNKKAMLALISGSAVAGGVATYKAERIFGFSSDSFELEPVHWISLSVLLLLICMYIVVSIKFNKRTKECK